VQAIGMADVPAYAAAIGLIFHIPFNWFFIYFLGWGYLGCAVATVCFQVIQPVFVVGYLFGSAQGRSRVLESTGGLEIGRTSLSFWLEFRLAVYSMRGIIKYLVRLKNLFSPQMHAFSPILLFLTTSLAPSFASRWRYQALSSYRNGGLQKPQSFYRVV
jgi:hypothetical protein